MPSRMPVRHLLSACLLAVAPPCVARAQEPTAARDTTARPAATLPTPATWGAELGIGAGQSATLLRFGSPRSALLLGVDAFWVDVSEEFPSLGGTRRERYRVANITGRLGFRRYRATPAAVRPFTSLGLIAGYAEDPGGPGWTVGAFGEIGASYFVSPHVSLGAAGSLQATYVSARQDVGAGDDLRRRQFGIRATSVYLLGAVYF
jgi:hypothetical protein